MCDCRVCRYSRHVEEIRDNGDLVSMRRLIDELYENLCHAEMDRDWSRAKLSECRVALHALGFDERRLHDNYPALKAAWQQYEMVRQMCKDYGT